MLLNVFFICDVITFLWCDTFFCECSFVLTQFMSAVGPTEYIFAVWFVCCAVHSEQADESLTTGCLKLDDDNEFPAIGQSAVIY